MKGYHTYWNIGKGDNGVSIYSKEKPVKVTNDLPDTDFADAKRLITAEYEKFFLIATYVVNAGQGLKTLDKRLQWNDAFDAHVAELNKKKPVIICGDLNVSHQEIDLANPKVSYKFYVTALASNETFNLCRPTRETPASPRKSAMDSRNFSAQASSTLTAHCTQKQPALTPSGATEATLAPRTWAGDWTTSSSRRA